MGGRTRAGVTLVLGVLVGIGLTILPGVLAPHQVNITSTNPNVRAPSTYTVNSAGSGTQNNQPTSTTTNPVDSLIVILGLVMFPAIASSILVQRWTWKRAKEKLESKGQ